MRICSRQASSSCCGGKSARAANRGNLVTRRERRTSHAIRPSPTASQTSNSHAVGRSLGRGGGIAGGTGVSMNGRSAERITARLGAMGGDGFAFLSGSQEAIPVGAANDGGRTSLTRTSTQSASRTTARTFLRRARSSRNTRAISRLDWISMGSAKPKKRAPQSFSMSINEFIVGRGARDS